MYQQTIIVPIVYVCLFICLCVPMTDWRLEEADLIWVELAVWLLSECGCGAGV